jgi:hypothetical protein
MPGVELYPVRITDTSSPYFLSFSVISLRIRIEATRAPGATTPFASCPRTGQRRVLRQECS